MRPTPVLKGKSAERFYELINEKEISKEQEEYLQECYEKYLSYLPPKKIFLLDEDESN